MPWLLSETSDQRRISWFPCDENWNSISGPRTERDDYIHDPAGPALRFQQNSKHKVLPDLMSGHPSGAIFVSKRMQALIEEMEPFTHRYIPTILRTIGGRILEGEFFLFKHGAYIEDGVIEEKSKAVLMGKHEETKFYSTPAHPKITWKSNAISGHHFFTDKYLRDRTFVSDEFFKRMKRETLLTPFRPVESPAE